MCRQILVNLLTPDFMKILTAVLKLLYADRQTDVAKILVEFF
jgi:hypothetical protein